MSDRDGNATGRDCARWDIPAIDDGLPAIGGTGGGNQAGQRSYEEGYARGREEALAIGRQELQAQVALLQRLMQALTQPFAELDEAVETSLLELATTIAQQVIRRELTTDPELILTVIREAIAVLPEAARSITLQLHPEDARLVRQHMPAPLEEGLWRMVEDAACTRGGCVVTTEHSRLDATIEQQVARIADAVLGAAGDEGGGS